LTNFGRNIIFLKVSNNILIISLSISFLNLILIFFLFAKIYKFNKRIAFLEDLKGSKTLEELLKENLENFKEIERAREELKLLSEKILNFFPKFLQKIGIVRFKAFEDVGGAQSFSLAILDGKDNGVVITSIYGRDQSRSYAKPIKEGTSKYPLSEEEKQAIKIAQEGEF
jgi:uncharacterized coiled-coil protein SlyX